LVIVIMVTALDQVAHGHNNHAITIGVWVTKRINTMEALLYWAAQLLGGIIAAYNLKSAIPDDNWRAVALGTPELARDFPVWAGMSLDAVGTLFFMLVFYVLAFDV